MSPELTSQAWVQIRYDYEHTDRPIEDICAEHGISSGTLRDRMRRWRWTRRRPPIPLEGPPPLPAPQLEQVGGIAGLTATPTLPLSGEGRKDVALPPGIWEDDDPAAPGAAAAPPIETAAPYVEAMPPVAAGDQAPTPGESDDNAIVPRLQSAVARVLPAIEATVVKLGAGPMQPREMEQTARALASLTRTLRELNGLLSQRQAAAADDVAAHDDMPEDIDAFRLDLARRIDAFVASRTGGADGGAEMQGG